MKKYNDKKEKNQVVAKFAKHYVSKNMADYVESCASWIEFITDETTEKRRWMHSNTCKWRFCPMCAWRKSMRDALMIATILHHINIEHDKEFIFLTLTTPNVTGDKLVIAVKELNKGFDTLFKRKAVKEISAGTVRKLEITYNKEKYITSDMWNGTGSYKGRSMAGYFLRRGLEVGDINPNYDTYHPHLHVIVAVEKGKYFKTRKYISQAKWLDMWQQSMKNPDITQVDVRKVKTSSGEIGGFDVQEFAKYTAKDADYLVSEDVFDTFYAALKGIRAMSYNGIFQDARKLYKSGELPPLDSRDKIEYVWELMFRWESGEYKESKRRKLDEFDQKLLSERGLVVKT